MIYEEDDMYADPFEQWQEYTEYEEEQEGENGRIEDQIPRVLATEYDRLPNAHKAIIGGYNAVLTANGWLTVIVVKG
ncbi:hypothetical protein [Paenibacillus sp. S150]|uniref:hypothetical protein n=1 Tax=Paenibacillus sp. S150 TaxID=2749826 RepID=UPI001C5A2951|nr:hypothetical protein [Paenibacillus sp. S150]MBW4083557.1 hypothetical protein [Paenibacillus sp. S150]